MDRPLVEEVRHTGGVPPYPSRWSRARPMTAFRSAAVVMPSSPNPSSSDRGVVIAAPTGNPRRRCG